VDTAIFLAKLAPEVLGQRRGLVLAGGQKKRGAPQLRAEAGK
jgi:hypothetical protein